MNFFRAGGVFWPRVLSGLSRVLESCHGVLDALAARLVPARDRPRRTLARCILTPNQTTLKSRRPNKDKRNIPVPGQVVSQGVICFLRDYMRRLDKCGSFRNYSNVPRADISQTGKSMICNHLHGAVLPWDSGQRARIYEWKLGSTIPCSWHLPRLSCCGQLPNLSSGDG